MNVQEKQGLLDYKIVLAKTYEKSQEDFEKQLSYISSGGLGLSMAFIDQIVKDINRASCKVLLTISWALLGLTLVVNLISHLLSSRFTYKTIAEIDNTIIELGTNQYSATKAATRNLIITWINLSTIISLLIGVTCLIIFVTINI